MGISAGTRLGPYQIVSSLGAGGMGEVYRARDTRLDRDVAVKVLPSHIALRAAARARFDREARAISALNHPNICTLFDVGTEGDTAYLVMELIDGESLAALLPREKLPIDRLLRYAIEICAALDKAHRQGIVHRDLKPGNVMITRTGVKLVDFGLARLANPAPELGPDAPTVAAPVTAEGTIVGTLQYMSPEQLEGKATDSRTDIFAFGCVLYEMLAGRRAFEGSSQATIIGAIMHSEPQPLSELAPLVPPALGRLVQKCLAKSADDRWQNAGDLVTELQWILEAPLISVAPRRRSTLLPWAVALGSSLAAIALGVITLSRHDPAPLLRLGVPLDGRKLVISHFGNPLAVSPDGQYLAFVAHEGGRQMLHVRSFADGSVAPIPGSESARMPTWAPDSSQIAFVSGSKLMKTTPGGENPTKICDAAGAWFASWGRDGTIVFVAQGRLHRVGAGGGTPKAISIAPLPAGASPVWPVFVDSNRVAYGVVLESKEIRLHVVSLKNGDDHDFGTVDSRFEIVDDVLLFVRDGVLLAQRVDVDLGRTSEPVQVAPGVMNYSTIGLADFSASPNVVAYVGSDTDARATWFDRSGAVLGTVGPVGAENPPRSSRDASRLVISATDPRSGTDDLWVCDHARDACARITDTRAGEILPVWSPDGTLIAFGTDATNSIATIRPDGGGVTTIAKIDRSPFLSDWSPDGKSLILFGSKGDASIGLLAPKPGSVMTTGRASPFASQFPRVSPNGKWIAYGSPTSGELETWLAPFGRDGDAIQVSSGGGGSPAWRADGRELYYATKDHRMYAVDVVGESPLRIGPPRLLFRAAEGSWDGYDVMPNGDRFVITRTVAGPATRPIHVVVNWKRLLDSAK